LAQIVLELPLPLDTVEQGLALMAFGMGRRMDAGTMPDWCRQGLALKHLLPWVQERAAYEQKPAAYLDYAYLKLITRKLREHAKSVPDDDQTTFVFDGATLTVTCRDEVLEYRVGLLINSPYSTLFVNTNSVVPVSKFKFSVSVLSNTAFT